MSGCDYCEDGEGAVLIAYARTVKQLMSNHAQRLDQGIDPATSALSVVNAIVMLEDNLPNPTAKVYDIASYQDVVLCSICKERKLGNYINNKPVCFDCAAPTAT